MNLNNLTREEIEEIVHLINAILHNRSKKDVEDTPSIKSGDKLCEPEVNTDSAFDLAWTNSNSPGIFITHGN